MREGWLFFLVGREWFGGGCFFKQHQCVQSSMGIYKKKKLMSKFPPEHLLFSPLTFHLVTTSPEQEQSLSSGWQWKSKVLQRGPLPCHGKTTASKPTCMLQTVFCNIRSQYNEIPTKQCSRKAAGLQFTRISPWKCCLEPTPAEDSLAVSYLTKQTSPQGLSKTYQRQYHTPATT